VCSSCHGLCDVPSQWESRNFDPPTAPTFFNRSFWNSKPRKISRIWPCTQSLVDVGRREGGLRKWWILAYFWFFLFTRESRMLRASLPSSGRLSVCPSVCHTRHFAVIGWNNVKTVTDRYIHAWTPQKEVFSEFFTIFGCSAHFNTELRRNG